MKEKNIQELAIRMGLISVDDMCQYTISQLVIMVANKVNELVGEVWRFETDVQETLKTQNENIQYLLGEGLHLEVENIFDGWVNDGTFDTLINQTTLKKVNDRIDETNAQLSQRIEVEKSRIDSLTTLEDGSTTGDAELVDARVGASGFTYKNVGTAIRHQVTSINRVVDEVARNLIRYTTLTNTYREGVGYDKNNNTNKVVDYTASNIKCVSFDVSEGEEYKLKTTIGNNWWGFIYSDKDNNFIGGGLKQSAWQLFENVKIVIPPTCTKLLINCENTKEVILERKVYGEAISEPIVDAKITSVKARTGTTMKTINRLGYRGNGGNENTMYAFKEAVKKGFNILLCDVRFTSDNVGVSLHDASINRTARNTDGSLINNTINIKDITLQQANQYDYGISGGVSEKGIVTIEMLVKLCKMTNCELYLEYKDGSFSQYDVLFKMINRYGMMGNTTLTAGLNVLQRYGAKYPELRLGLNSSYSEENITELAKLITDKNEVFLFGWDSDNLTTEQVEFMSTNKVGYEFGNVNDVDMLIRLMNTNMAYASRIESDNLLIEEELFNHAIN